MIVFQTIKHIINNYDSIQESMKSNKLPDNDTFYKSIKRNII